MMGMAGVGIAARRRKMQIGGRLKKARRHGHVIGIKDRNVGDPDTVDRLADELAVPGVSQIMVRWDWQELETSAGAYVLDGTESIQHYLDTIAASENPNARLIVMIEVKAFTGSVPANPMPAYMAAYTLETVDTGYYSAKLWDPYVSERYGLLVKAIGERFDHHKNFGGIAHQETSIGIPLATLFNEGYTAELYAQSIIDRMSSIVQWCPKSDAYLFFNYISSTPVDAVTAGTGGQTLMATILEAMVSLDVICGGPDILPDNTSLNNLVYPLYEAYKDRLTLFCSCQKASFSTAYTMQQLFEFARDTLHCSMVFWNNRPVGETYDNTHSRAVMSGTPEWFPV